MKIKQFLLSTALLASPLVAATSALPSDCNRDKAGGSRSIYASATHLVWHDRTKLELGGGAIFVGYVLYRIYSRDTVRSDLYNGIMALLFLKEEQKVSGIELVIQGDQKGAVKQTIKVATINLFELEGTVRKKYKITYNTKQALADVRRLCEISGLYAKEKNE